MHGRALPCRLITHRTFLFPTSFSIHLALLTLLPLQTSNRLSALRHSRVPPLHLSPAASPSARPPTTSSPPPHPNHGCACLHFHCFAWHRHSLSLSLLKDSPFGPPQITNSLPFSPSCCQKHLQTQKMRQLKNTFSLHLFCRSNFIASQQKVGKKNIQRSRNSRPSLFAACSPGGRTVRGPAGRK